MRLQGHQGPRVGLGPATRGQHGGQRGGRAVVARLGPERLDYCVGGGGGGLGG